jgi:hypothetical protein
MGAKQVCIRCGWSDTRPSRYHGFGDTLAAAFFLQPFRCRKCGNRFFRFRNARARVGVLASVVVIIAVLAMAIVKNAPARQQPIQQGITDILPR